METLKLKNFPKDSDNVIKEQYIMPHELYIVTRSPDLKFKLFLIDNNNAKGKKIAESKDINSIHERIPDYK